GSPNGSGGDFVQGGGGPDVINFRGDFGVARGGGGNDVLNNFGGINRLYGEAGNDLLAGRSGGNTESGYDGGTGNDTLDFSAATVGMFLRNGTFGEYFSDTGVPPIVKGASADSAAGFENFYGGKGDD